MRGPGWLRRIVDRRRAGTPLNRRGSETGFGDTAHHTTIEFTRRNEKGPPPFGNGHSHRWEYDALNGQCGLLTNKPARLGGGDLLGCTAQRAEAAEQVLTTIYNSGLDAIAVRLSGIVRQPQG